MRKQLPHIGKVSFFAAGLATTWSTMTAAQGLPCGMASTAGGSGPPSISETETSTTEVLEQIRRRVQTAQQVQPIPASYTTSSGGPSPGSSSATAAEQQATTSGAQSQAAQAGNSATLKAKKTAPSTTYAEPSDYPRYASLKDYGSATDAVYEGQVSRSTAVWAQGFGGYERHSNLAPGDDENPTRNQVTGGGMGGMDWTVIKRGETPQAFQFGVFSGFSETNNTFSNTSFQGSVDTTNDVTFSRSNNSQDINGPFVGAYLAYATGVWTFDLAFKADFFDLSQRSSLAANTTCGASVFLNGTQQGSASVNDYIIAGEASHRTPLTTTSWIEPAFAIRFTATNFSGDTNAATFGSTQGTTLAIANGSLGLDDGTSLRLQGGVRYGEVWQTPQGYHLTTTLGAFLYSDVLITGFENRSGIVSPGGALNTVGPVDEGKVRGLGQLTSQLDVGNGLSYVLLTEVYGGDDVVGVDGQLGLRYHW